MEFALFRQFDDLFFHTVTDRFGGISQTPYDSLNLALHVGDDLKNVLQNRIRTSEKYNFDIKNLIFMDQVHGSEIAVIEHAMENRKAGIDAMITAERNIPLMVMVADCIPILFYDPVKKVVAVAHAGRNGTFLRIAPKTVFKMQAQYGCDIQDILIGMGPSIQRCCYEVGEDLADICTKNFGKGFIMIEENKYFLDLQALNLAQLKESGIAADNIEISSVCTACDKNYFSYRREGVTGRFAGFIMLR